MKIPAVGHVILTGSSKSPGERKVLFERSGKEAQVTLMNRRAALILLSSTVAVATSKAADLRQPTPLASDAKSAYTATLAYMNRYTVLLMIRATFNVVDADAIGEALGAKLQQLGAAGPTDVQEEELAADLLGEGSYYLISLKYTILVGGAIWPPDRAESVYRQDALAILDQLEQELIDAVSSHADPLQIFVRGQKVRATTEGELAVSTDEDRFADRDSLVANAISSFGAWANT